MTTSSLTKQSSRMRDCSNWSRKRKRSKRKLKANQYEIFHKNILEFSWIHIFFSYFQLTFKCLSALYAGRFEMWCSFESSSNFRSLWYNVEIWTSGNTYCQILTCFIVVLQDDTLAFIGGSRGGAPGARPPFAWHTSSLADLGGARPVRTPPFAWHPSFWWYFGTYCIK